MFERIGLVNDYLVNEVHPYDEADIIDDTTKKQGRRDYKTTQDLLCQNIVTLLYPDREFLMPRQLIDQFMQALICNNNLQNEYRSDTYDSEKQLHMMRIIWQFKQERMIFSPPAKLILCGTDNF